MNLRPEGEQTYRLSFSPNVCFGGVDPAGSNKEAQVTVSVGSLPVLFLPKKTSEREEHSDLINKRGKISGMLRSMSDGEISISAYDTAWVALIPSINGGGGPQFPESLKWIEESQLVDGSWGDGDLLIAHDRLMNTLACVIALKSWGVSPDKCNRGL